MQLKSNFQASKLLDIHQQEKSGPHEFLSMIVYITTSLRWQDHIFWFYHTSWIDLLLYQRPSSLRRQGFSSDIVFFIQELELSSSPSGSARQFMSTVTCVKYSIFFRTGSGEKTEEWPGENYCRSSYLYPYLIDAASYSVYVIDFLIMLKIAYSIIKRDISLISCSASVLKLIQLDRTKWGRRQLLHIGRSEI